MKIVQLIDTLRLGGAEVMAVNLSNLLASEGHEVTLCVSREGGPLKSRLRPDVQLVYLEKKSALDLSALKKLNKVIKSQGIEVVHAHSSSVLWAIILKMFFGNFKLVWHDHFGFSQKIKDGKPNTAGQKGYRLYIRLFSFFIDDAFSVNQDLKSWAENFTWIKGQVVMLENFSLIQKSEEPSEFPFPYVLMVANVRPQKGHLFMLQAMNAFFGQTTSDWHLLVVGSPSDANLFRDFEEALKASPYKQRIHFLGPHADVAHLMTHAQAGILTSVSEGLPVTILEFGQLGIPMVVTDVGACAEALGNPDLVVKYGDVQAFSSALLRLSDNAEYREKAAQAFKKHAAHKYGTKKIYQKILNVYQGTK
jgi:glycosyltransferase involved in cell wall biosynthesis